MKEIKKSEAAEYLRVIKEDFKKYKGLGDKTFLQLDEKDFHFKFDEESNSIAVIMQHISGNIISRFTDFFNSDGEKPERNRDAEFEEAELQKTELISTWEKSWQIFFSTLDDIKEVDLVRTVKIRNEPHSVIEALNRQATHYAYHIGQIVLIAKHLKKDKWQTLSVPKKKSEQFNKEMFSKKQ